ncbi:MAG: translation initiation factor IF-2 [Clostridia bacterium]|nr:translation initiation factor IF-2 [Clostridia bacterium]
MANTDKKNEYDKIQAINNFVKDVASPLANNIKSLKSKLNRISDNLTKKRSELKSLEKAETVKKDVALENAEVISDPVEMKEPIVESVAARPEEVVSSNDGGDVVISAKKETAEVVKPIEKPRVETPENVRREAPRNSGEYTRVQGDRRPQQRGDAPRNNGYTAMGGNTRGDFQRGDRNGFDRRPPYNNNANGQDRRGGMQQGRPFNQGGANGNRPMGARPNFNGNQRPNGSFQQKPMGGGFGGAKFAPIDLPKDTKKKKVNSDKPNKAVDDSKRLNKKTMIRKGYISEDIDINSELDDNATIRHFKVKKTKKQEFVQPTAIIEHAIVNTNPVAIKTLGEKIGKTATELVKKLFILGQMCTVNDSVDFETAELIAGEYNVTLELQLDKTAEDRLKDIMSVSEMSENLVKRPPIVTIMGHVDHGKTSLLDYIRKSHVTSGEAGGITQHIGAYTISVKGEKITFLDTPGHEAFITMRKRGAMVTDIAIIVVAADDGIMPQTQEAISHAREAGVSIMVAINKIDKPEANIERVKQDLTNYGLVPEEWGGDVIVCPVSAKTGEGVDNLLENITLLAEVKELKADPKVSAQGSILEARLDKGTGPVATVLVQNGTLKVKDFVVAGTAIGTVRAMIDDKNNSLKEAGPAVAVSVLGFKEVPSAGDQLIVVKDEKLAKQVASERAKQEREQMQKISSKKNLEDMFKNMAEGEKKVLPIIIKGDVQGSVEAVKEALEKLSNEMSEDGVKITFPLTAVGAVNESDAMLAETANAIIIAFNVRPDPKAKAYAERNKIDIKYFRVIYELIDTIRKAMDGMLEPTFEENIIGHAEVREVFNITGVGTIAGSYVTDGKVMRNAKIRFLRDNIVIYEGSISSLKRMKDDVKEVAKGYECGIGLEGISDIKIGDTMEAFVMEKVEKK